MAGVGKLGLLPSQVRAGSRSECHQGEAGVRSRGGGSARRPQGRGPASWEAVRLEGVAGGTVAGRKKVPCFQKLRRRLSMPWCGTPSLHSGSTSSLLRKGCLLTLCLQSGTVLCFIPLVPSKSLRFRIWVSLRVSFSFFFFFFSPSTF